MRQQKIGIQGLAFLEFSSRDPVTLGKLFHSMGFSKKQRIPKNNVEIFQQEQIFFLLNSDADSFGRDFVNKHGPCVSSMGLFVTDPQETLALAIQRGAEIANKKDYPFAAIKGIGESLIYFLPQHQKSELLKALASEPHPNPCEVESFGLEFIDHLTNNVEQGTMAKWANFYKDILEFTEVRYFDIRGVKTGLTSFALRSPCGTFCIPINEGTEDKSQINEYLREYKGPGVQHIALHTSRMIDTISAIKRAGIQTLDIDDEYYQEVFQRVPGVSEDPLAIRKNQILVDGDEEGYLLQIFTKNLIGPIFFEIIQRKNHLAFGEGNFGALFRSIEREQEKQGKI